MLAQKKNSLEAEIKQLESDLKDGELRLSLKEQSLGNDQLLVGESVFLFFFFSDYFEFLNVFCFETVATIHERSSRN